MIYSNKNLKIIDKFLPIGILLIMLAMIAGCAGNSKYGKYKLDAGVQQAFETNQVPREYQYFHYSDSEPYVLLGLDTSYQMNSRMWREVQSDTEAFEEMIVFIWEDYGYYKFGADILNPEGKKVGIMYTAIKETSIKFVGENEIVVMPHTPYLWGPTAGGGVRSR